MTNFKALRLKVVVPVSLVVLFTAFAGLAQAQSIIYVTSLDDTVGAGKGCTLKEAIYSANLDDNVAVAGFDAQGNAQYVTTQCVPGSGNDIIVLPTGTNPVVLVLDTYANDLNNVAGPSVSACDHLEHNHRRKRGNP